MKHVLYVYELKNKVIMFGYRGTPHKSNNIAKGKVRITEDGYKTNGANPIKPSSFYFYKRTGEDTLSNMWIAIKELLWSILELNEDVVVCNLKSGSFSLIMNNLFGDMNNLSDACMDKELYNEVMKYRQSCSEERIALVKNTLFPEVNDIVKWCCTVVQPDEIPDGMYEYKDPKFFKMPKIFPPEFFGKYIIVDKQFYKEDNKYNYILARYPTDTQLGRNINMVTESYIQEDEPIPYLDNIITEMMRREGTTDTMLTMELDLLTDMLVYKELSMFKDVIKSPFKYVKKSTHSELTTLSGVRVIYTVYPPGLMIKLLDNRKKVLQYDKEVDITNRFYITTDKGLKIDPELTQSKHIKSFTLPEGKVVLMLGVDSLNRNVYKRLENIVKKVSLIYTIKERVIHYAVKVTLTTGYNITHSPTNSIALVRKNKKL